jgi:hypothetical protein
MPKRQSFGRRKPPFLFVSTWSVYIGSPTNRNRLASNSKTPGAGIGHKAASKFYAPANGF